MDETNRNARLAGFIYVLLAIVAPVRLIYIPGQLFVKGDAAATAANIAAHEGLFRFGILTDLLTGVLGLAVGLALYRLFKRVDEDQAKLMFILGALMVTPIYFLNTLNDAGALIMATRPDYLLALDKAQTDAWTMVFLKLHTHGVVANEVFWGLWLFPFGLLIWRSGFLPRFLAVLLFANGFAYLAQAYLGVMAPDLAGPLGGLLFPLQMGEVVVMLWLLIMGARRPAAAAPA